jgi:uncharacterized protein YggE
MNMARLALAVMSLLTLAAIACNNGDTIVEADATNRSGINVSATGRAVGTPDVVVLQLGVDVEMRSVEEARSAAARAMQSVIDSLKANGIADKDIQTVQFSVSPQYDFPNNRQTLRGYRVSNVVTAKLRKLDMAGKAIDDASNASGNTAIVRSVSFTIDDPTTLQAEARQKAMDLAKDRAEQLARPSGAKLGRVIAISEGTPPQPFPQAPAAVAAPRTGDFTTPIQTGELEIVVTVNVLYAIE